MFTPRTGPVHYRRTHSTHWVPHSRPHTVTSEKPFHPHRAHFPEEGTGFREVVQLTATSTGQGYSNPDAPTPSECREGSRVGTEAGRPVEAERPSPRQEQVGDWRGATVWRNGSEPQLQVHELFAALQGPHPVYRGRRGSTCAGQTLHLPIFQERLEIQILHEIFESLKVLINLFPVGDYCVVCGNQAGPTPQPRGQLSERLDNQT